MSLPRSQFKAAIAALLDEVASEHPEGHQANKARRYTIGSGGSRIEVMLERDDASQANLWVTTSAAGPLIGSAIPNEVRPSSELWTKRGKDGALNYGRHSALERMPQLGGADLVKFTPRNLADLGTILDRLLEAVA
jgi:hypothetical protein